MAKLNGRDYPALHDGFVHDFTQELLGAGVVVIADDDGPIPAAGVRVFDVVQPTAPRRVYAMGLLIGRTPDNSADQVSVTWKIPKPNGRAFTLTAFVPEEQRAGMSEMIASGADITTAAIAATLPEAEAKFAELWTFPV